MNRLTKKQEGFTVVEILVSVAVTAIVAGVIGAFQANVFSLGRTTDQSLRAADEARRILRPMTDYIRSAVAGENGAYPVASASATELVFYVDYDKDDVVEKIRFYLDDGSVKQGVIEPSGTPSTYTGTESITTLVSDVISAGIFTYYDTNYDGTTDPLVAPISATAVRVVEIGFSIDADTNKPPAPVEVGTVVTIRTIKDNL